MIKKEIFENAEVIEKWHAFVRVNLQRGESIDAIKIRLASNNLSSEQIDLIIDPVSKNVLNDKNRKRNTIYALLGAFKLLAGILLTMAGIEQNGIPILGPLFIIGGIIWLSKIRRI